MKRDDLEKCTICRAYIQIDDLERHVETFDHRLAEQQMLLKAEGWARTPRLYVPFLHAAHFPVQVLNLEERWPVTDDEDDEDDLRTTLTALSGETPSNYHDCWTRKWVRDLIRDTWADLKSLPLPHRRGQLLGALKIWRDNHRDPVLDQWEFRIDKIHSPKPKV